MVKFRTEIYLKGQGDENSRMRKAMSIFEFRVRFDVIGIRHGSAVSAACMGPDSKPAFAAFLVQWWMLECHCGLLREISTYCHSVYLS